jgi:hypothetical protein
MKTKTIEVYKYDELSDRAKETACQWWSNGALDYDWWNFTYEDAAQAGIKITSFDTGRSWDITGDFLGTADETAEKILENHGDTCGTSAEARHYQQAMAEFLATAEYDEYGELASYALEHKKEEIEREFLRCLLQEYLIILRNESEYLLSDEHAEEMIIANDYDFTAEGRIF